MIRRIKNAFGMAMVLMGWSLLVMADASLPPEGMAIPPGIMTWWPGEGCAEDIMGKTGGQTVSEVTFVQGKVGQAFHFSGKGTSYVAVPDTPAIRLGTESFTIEFWTRPDTFVGRNSTSDGIRLMEKKAYPVTWWNIDILPTGQIEMEMADHASVSGNTISDGKIIPDEWAHLAIVVDRVRHQTLYYINGELDSRKEFSADFKGHLDIEGRPLDIGSGGWNNYAGCMDELSFYGRVLTASEIRAITRAGSEGKQKPALRRK